MQVGGEVLLGCTGDTVVVGGGRVRRVWMIEKWGWIGYVDRWVWYRVGCVCQQSEWGVGDSMR